MCVISGNNFFILADLELNGLESGNGDEKQQTWAPALSSGRSVLTSLMASGVSLDYDVDHKPAKPSKSEWKLRLGTASLTLARVSRMAKWSGGPLKDRQAPDRFELEGQVALDEIGISAILHISHRDRRRKTLTAWCVRYGVLLCCIAVLLIYRQPFLDSDR